MPGKYIKSPAVYGEIKGVEANWVGFSLGLKENNSCTEPFQETKVVNGQFTLNTVEDFRIIGMSFPASCATNLNVCFKVGNHNYKWNEQIMVDCNSIYSDFKLVCLVVKGKLGCSNEHR